VLRRAIVQCGSRVTNDSGNETYESIGQIASQLVDPIDLMGLARRTGRFPQLVDSRSGV